MSERNILVLGATGQTGRLIVEEALDRGHRVKALVRSQDKLGRSHPNLQAIEGDATNTLDLERALAGCDAAVMALGHPQKWNSLFVGVKHHRHLLRDAAYALVQAMPKAGLKRIIAISACGAGDSFELVPAWFKLMIRYTGIKQPYKDHGDQEEALKASPLDWTLVRPTRLKDQKMPGQLGVDFNAEPRFGYEVSRANVARFCVASIEQADLIGKCPILSENSEKLSAKNG